MPAEPLLGAEDPRHDRAKKNFPGEPQRFSPLRHAVHFSCHLPAAELTSDGGLCLDHPQGRLIAGEQAGQHMVQVQGGQFAVASPFQTGAFR